MDIKYCIDTQMIRIFHCRKTIYLFILLSYNGLNNLNDIAKVFSNHKGISINCSLEYVEKVQNYFISERIIFKDENKNHSY